MAIKHSNNNLAELLLQHGCDLSILDSSEEDLISFTVMHQRETTMLEKLLTLGCIDINKVHNVLYYLIPKQEVC